MRGVMDDEGIEPRTFNTADRCDQCGAQAHASATVNGTELLFCGHHFETNFEKLLTSSHGIIVDARHFTHRP